MTPPDDLARAVEAVLFAAPEPLTIDAIAAHVGVGDVRAALRELRAVYAGRGIELAEHGGRWHFRTAADLAHLLRRDREEPRKLSRAGIETLAIIAYHEPVTRAEIEAIRGVQISKGTIDVLMEAGWVRPAGRREVPGRPLMFATTPDFLVHFGLQSRRDLPGIEDLRAAGLLDPVDLAFEMAGTQDEVEKREEDDQIGYSVSRRSVMGGFSPIHLLVLAVVAILLLGGGRFSNLMGDVAKGVKNFKKGMAEEEEESRSSARIEAKKAADPAFDRDGNRVRDGLHEDR